MDASLSLLQVFEESKLLECRRARGLRHPLGAILALTTVAILSGARSQAAIVDFARSRGLAFRRLLGFRKFQPPSRATLCRVLKSLDVVEFEACIRRWLLARAGSRRFEHIAIDGKSVRGSRHDDLPAVHLLTAYAPEIKMVMAQLRVDAKTNEHKAALEMLGVLPLKGKVITADAMFTHRDFCTKVREGGGDYVLPAKDNQPLLRGDILAAFADPPAGLSPPAEERACGDVRLGQLAR